MQGTAADIIKRAMIAVNRWLIEDGDRTKMIMQVHDELVFELDAEDVERSKQEIGRLMIEAADLSVALEVDSGVGLNWNEAH
jgi:DNA polymerase-1